MKKQRYKVRFFLSTHGAGIPIGSFWNPSTNERKVIYSYPKQYDYKADTVTDALKKGMRYIPKGCIISSYTVTDRISGEKRNYKVG